jgi:hypothetical protein
LRPSFVILALVLLVNGGSLLAGAGTVADEVEARVSRLHGWTHVTIEVETRVEDVCERDFFGRCS